jgi:HAMP domain-containing protein
MMPLQLRTPSFRSRLRLFFVVIVVLPMITIAVVLFQLIVATERSQTDARLAESQTVSQEILRELEAEAGAVATRIGGDQKLADAMEAPDERRAIQRRLDQLTRQAGAHYVDLNLDGVGRFQTGSPPGVAPAERRLVDEDENPTGRLTVAMLSPEAYANRIAKLTGAHVVVEGDDQRFASTHPTAPAELPDKGDAAVDGADYRVRSFSAPGTGGEARVRLLMPGQDTADPTGRESLEAAIPFVAFLILAFVFAVAVSRSLQAEIQRLLVAAQRLGRGDFSVSVPPAGNDEFGALGKEFNSMARQLEARLEELQRERARLQEAIRRVGESFAAGLDRVGLMEIVVQTAVDGIGASAGRARPRRS